MGKVVGEHEAAERIGLAVSTLQKYRVSGGGPAFLKLGRAVRYTESDLDAWLSMRRVRSTSEAAGS